MGTYDTRGKRGVEAYVSGGWHTLEDKARMDERGHLVVRVRINGELRWMNAFEIEFYNE